MKYFLPFLVAMLFWNPIVSMNYHKVAAKTLKTSVLIRIKGIMLSPKDMKFHRAMVGCSGTYVSPDTILTAAHCFEGYMPVFTWVRDSDGVNGIRADLLMEDPQHDLALLRTKGANHAYAKLGSYEPRIGDSVLNIGSPAPFEFLVTEGIVAMKVPGYFMTTAFVDHGSSGGGAFDRRGRLIGVNVWKFPGGITGAVNLTTIKKFLEQTHENR